MRKASGPAVLGLLLLATPWACICVAEAPQMAAKAPSPPTSTLRMPWKVVTLDDAAELEHLRQTNFAHYLRARKILAAANEICSPGSLQVQQARFDGADPQCGLMWMTSYPPKKLLSFHLDGIHYLALVTVTTNLGKPVKAGDTKR
jgi:hypothetical protein